MVCVILFLVSFYSEKAHGAVITENFDSYSTGNLNGQGGWFANEDNPGTAIQVTNSVTQSAPNSVRNNSGSGGISDLKFATSTEFFLSYYSYNDGTGNSHNVRIALNNTTSINTDFNSSENFTVAVPKSDGSNQTVTVATGLSNATWYKLGLKYELVGGFYEVTAFVNDAQVFASTTKATVREFNRLRIVTSNGNNFRTDSISLLTGSDVNPVSRINSIDAPTNILYAFNPVPVEINYNQLDTYDFITFDVQNLTLGQNVFIPPAPIPPITNTNLTFEGDLNLGTQGEYTFRARLFDSENNLYTDWSDTITFGLGSTSTPPVYDYNVASTTFGTSTAIDSGNLLSYVNIPQLLLTKAPFGYFFQIYGIVGNTITNPPEATSLPIGEFDIYLNNSTTTVVMFSTSTVSTFLTPEIIAPIRTLLVAVIYLLTGLTAYRIVRHSHIL